MTATAAIFDVDGTLVRADVIDYYLFLVQRLLPAGQRFRRVAAVVLKAPYWLALDRFDRAKFNQSFYRCYEGLPRERVAAAALECFDTILRDRLLGPVVARLEEHRRRGERLILVSGSLDFLLEPLARHLGAEACLCPGLDEVEGSFTGRLTCPPVIGEEKANRMKNYAHTHGIDLALCHAYADSSSDLPILNLAGRATVVNPGFFLKREARRRGWEILNT